MIRGSAPVRRFLGQEPFWGPVTDLIGHALA